MVNVSSSSGAGRLYRRGMAQVSRESCAGQEATTRSVMCTVCKALYTPAAAHQQLALAPHIVLESAFMSMCHFCFRCRRAACPDCWDAVHGVCGACVEEAGLPFRRDVKPLGRTFPRSGQERQPAVEDRDNADVLVCIQHGRFYREPAETQIPNFAQPQRMSRPMRVATTRTEQEKEDGRVQGATYHYKPTSVVDNLQRKGKENERPQSGNRQRKSLSASVLSHQWVAETVGAIEQWATGAMLVLLLTIVTMIVVAEASPSANAQMMHVFQIDIRGEVAYLIHLIGH